MASISYLGHKLNLVAWLEGRILKQTGWESLQGRFIADLFAGSGAVSAHLRSKGARILSNDRELCSAVVTRALVSCQYTDQLAGVIKALNEELKDNKYQIEKIAGFLTLNYSPLGNRDYWTLDNARRMDYLRNRIEQLSISEHDRDFLLASLISSSDRVKNCCGEYSRFLKKGFQKSALRELLLAPIHTNRQPATAGSLCLIDDALTLSLPVAVQCVYLDPPYNERQYSKHYFPLSLLSMKPVEQAQQSLKPGVTGIPSNCYISPFSSASKKVVAKALHQLIRIQPKGCWIFLSYSSEGTLRKRQIKRILQRFGRVTVESTNHKRLRGLKTRGQKNAQVCEFLFSLHKDVQ